MPLNNMTVGVDKTNDVAWLSLTVETLNCESPHVSHIPHLRLLVGLGLGWASWGNPFRSVTLTPFNSTVFLFIKCEESKNRKRKPSRFNFFKMIFFRNHRSSQYQYLHEEYQFYRKFFAIHFFSFRPISSTEDIYFRGRYSSNISNSSMTYRSCVHL